MRAGFDAALDELRALRDESRRVIAALQAHYANAPASKHAEDQAQQFLGYYIEVPQAHGEKLLGRRSTQTSSIARPWPDAMRFTTTELAELEAKIASAADRALALELAIFDALRRARAGGDRRDQGRGRCAGRARCRARPRRTRATARAGCGPQVDDIARLRHRGRAPSGGGSGAAQRAATLRRQRLRSAPEARRTAGAHRLVTGPNMAGKSTYPAPERADRHAGADGLFVPARNAHIGVVDRLFSRVGAADDLARGRSTFMVEMVETAAILNQATRALARHPRRDRPRHGDIRRPVDRLGGDRASARGQPLRALFATHFHELTALAQQAAALANVTMRVTDWNGDVIFLHEVMPGAADRSYGIQVARLAGLPAQSWRGRRRSRRARSGRAQAPAALIDDLPLFAAAVRPKPTEKAAQACTAAEALLGALDESRPRCAEPVAMRSTRSTSSSGSELVLRSDNLRQRLTCQHTARVSVPWNARTSARLWRTRASARGWA